ncbi:hypothetical protein [Metabacillus fastidiosus]|uniref:hypothetical protein n=1 Tax=Metabacillus fastidiosus TaxID=1458 RepID=UPI002E1BD00F|nr:hypothetical protein [Metabacillus fastidiosus]
MKAYENNGLYVYDDQEKEILIDYDPDWGISTAYKENGDETDLSMFFPLDPTLQQFEETALTILKDNPYMFGGE